MKILILNASINSPGHGNDAGGAFVPEAINFAKYRTGLGDTCVRVPFDNSIANKKKRGDAFLELIRKAEPFDAFAYFGHGLRNSLSSAAIGQDRRQELVALLKSKAAGPRMIVTLYACSTGETTTGQKDGDGGFADRLRDDLEAAGLVGWVDGHTCAAHTTRNPYVRRFTMGPEGNTGGPWLVAPSSPEWDRWRSRLNPPKGVTWKQEPFRFIFPFLEQEAVLAACR